MDGPGLVKTFGRVWNSSGARNFFGEGWPHHRWLGPLGPRWEGSTFVVKTTTLHPRAGNMPLRGTTPVERFPRCIRVNWRRRAILNAVGLSGPGLGALLDDGRWQARTEPFVLSFMAVGISPEDRGAEYARFIEMLGAELPRFHAPVALEVNFSCPNVGHDPGHLIGEVHGALDILGMLGIPLLPKLNVLAPVAAAPQIAEHPACAGLVVSNTVPYGRLPDRINWRGLFGEPSPLAHLGGGGLSGAPLLPLVREWIMRARNAGLTKPIVGGGGILSSADAESMFAAGADIVELGVIGILRPWRIAGIIRGINRADNR